jgi:hypothetical protein
LSKSGRPNPLFEFVADFASLYGLANAVTTHRAIVVTNRRVFIIRMPWLRSQSMVHVSDLAAVAVSAFVPGSLPVGGLLFTPGNVRLQFLGLGYMDFWFGVDGSELGWLRAEAEAVVKALGGVPTSGDIAAR